MPEASEKRRGGTANGARRVAGIVRPEKVMRTEEDLFCDAASMLFEADFLLISAGAGFSADSGLPVYKVKAHWLIPWLSACLFPTFRMHRVLLVRC